jgi:tellurite resistance protein TehA-like permease
MTAVDRIADKLFSHAIRSVFCGVHAGATLTVIHEKPPFLVSFMVLSVVSFGLSLYPPQKQCLQRNRTLLLSCVQISLLVSLSVLVALVSPVALILFSMETLWQILLLILFMQKYARSAPPRSAAGANGDTDS